MVLTEDKEVALIIIDKDIYIEKYMALLSDEAVHCGGRDWTKSINFKIFK